MQYLRQNARIRPRSLSLLKFSKSQIRSLRCIEKITRAPMVVGFETEFRCPPPNPSNRVQPSRKFYNEVRIFYFQAAKMASFKIERTILSPYRTCQRRQETVAALCSQILKICPSFHAPSTFYPHSENDKETRKTFPE